MHMMYEELLGQSEYLIEVELRCFTLGDCVKVNSISGKNENMNSAACLLRENAGYYSYKATEIEKSWKFVSCCASVILLVYIQITACLLCSLHFFAFQL